MNDADRDGRRQRLGIILAVAAVVVFAGVTISIVGNRRVDSAVADIRERAQSTTIDPSTIALQSYDSSGHSLADADQDSEWLIVRRPTSCRPALRRTTLVSLAE